MGVRFRRTVKIGGVRLNFGGKGVSASIGIKGASATIGSRGVYGNIGAPGTGISFRSKLSGSMDYQSSRGIGRQEQISEQNTQSVPVRFIVDHETGKACWEDSDGNPLSDELVRISRQQHRDTIIAILGKTANEINAKIESLLDIHLETPSPDTQITYTPIDFIGNGKPLPPDESAFRMTSPNPPALQKVEGMSSKVAFLRNRIEQSNQKLLNEYQQRLKEWEEKQLEMDQELEKKKQRYSQELQPWQKEKEVFDQEQVSLKKYVEVDRLVDVEAMHDFLEEHLDAIKWQLDTTVSFEVAGNGKQVCVDVDLPEIDMLPSKTATVNHTKLDLTIKELPKTQHQRNYLAHIHGIGFRVIGETFVALPSVNEIILSGYSQRTNRQTGNIQNEYLYSTKVRREQWLKINFANLKLIDVVECFNSFDLRREINKSGVITPIEPFGIS